MKTRLLAQNICAGYRDRLVLQGVGMQVDHGERILLAGPNGSGKSTFLKTITGVISMKSGTLELNGEDIRSRATDWRRCNGLGYLKQNRNIFTSLSVHENLELASDNKAGGFEDRLRWALDIFPFLGRQIHSRSGLLSGGERKALAIAMILMRKTDVLLLDEPTAGLSPKAAGDILDAICRAQADEEFAMVIVEHNLGLITPMVSRAILMNQGRVLHEETEPSRLLDPKLLEQFYFA